MQLSPITRICLQTADGYYSIPFDKTAGIFMQPGSGTILVVHAGAAHSGLTANFRASGSPAQYAEIAAALLQPVATAQPGDDISALLATGAFVEVPPGHYPGFDAA